MNFGKTRSDAPAYGTGRMWGKRLYFLASLICCLSPAALAGSEARLILQTTALAGFQYYPGKALFPLMAVGDPLTLVREPLNPFDPKAVRVEWRGSQIGYAPKADNYDLARLMDRGLQVEARILQLQKARNPWKRVLIEIYLLEP